MAADEPTDIPKLTGFYKHFNSYTVKGKSNVVKAVCASLFLGYIFLKLKPSKKADK